MKSILKQQLLDLKEQLGIVYENLSKHWSTFDYGENTKFWDTDNAENLGLSIDNTIEDIDTFLEEELKEEEL